MNFYNEIDPFAASQLRRLIELGKIPQGVVDERSIEDLRPADLDGYTQCHFFAGIAGWPLALALADWPEDRPIWTGSCPCQPFSSAGKGAGFADERHLWPSFHWLIEQCRPAIVVGEQVASAAVGPWIDLVLTDLEALGYAVGAYAGPAAGVGAPHLRDRSYWVGYADYTRSQGHGRPEQVDDSQRRNEAERHCSTSGVLDGLADSKHDGRGGSKALSPEPSCDRSNLRLSDGGSITSDRLAYVERPGPTNGHWAAADWLGCRDGKWRPVEPGTFPLAHGLPARVGRLRGYGNAIVPQQAAQFIKALMVA